MPAEYNLPLISPVLKPAWQLRVIKEKAELDERIKLLKAFLLGPQAGPLDDKSLHLLTRQLVCMEEYSGILAERIDHFSNTKP